MRASIVSFGLSLPQGLDLKFACTSDICVNFSTTDGTMSARINNLQISFGKLWMLSAQ